MHFQAAAASSAATERHILPMRPPTLRPTADTPPQPAHPQRCGNRRRRFWSFFGIRRGDAMRRDVVTIKPHQVIVVRHPVRRRARRGLLILVR
jgi:hypothetical protein